MFDSHQPTRGQLRDIGNTRRQKHMRSLRSSKLVFPCTKAGKLAPMWVSKRAREIGTGGKKGNRYYRYRFSGLLEETLRIISMSPQETITSGGLLPL
jgi:hypothetical protein